MDLGSAVAALEASGLKAGTTTADFSLAASGTVASQSPSAGVEVAAGSDVTLVLSKGPRSLAVPSAVGNTQSDATALLESAGFDVTIKKVNNKAKKGTVVAQRPADGDARPGSEVVLSVSTGVQLIKVASLIGSYDFVMPWGSGRTTVPWGRLTSKGFKIRRVMKSNGEGVGIWLKIYRQSPAAGSWARKGSTVTVWILTP
jgi:serine/threonine-protein kinase